MLLTLWAMEDAFQCSCVANGKSGLDPPMATKTKKPAAKPGRSAIQDVVAREYTIHLHKRVSIDLGP